MIFLEEAQETPRNPEWSQLILCDLSLNAFDREQLLHFFGEVPAPEHEAAELSKPKVDL